ncbi:hypothetical protein SDJN03_17943, partial [Cucurbita argyrosperma subsp. sororia]
MNSAELSTTQRMSSPRRPLHTCSVSFLAIAHGIFSRAQNLDGWLGSTTRKMVQITKVVKPVILVLQCQWSLFLSFIDDRLLAISNFVEKIFPPSRLVFDKIDDVLHLVETFPGKFADAVDKLPCFNQVLLLEWAVTHAISLLEFMITILMNLGRDGTREKEILVDMNYNKGRNGPESAVKSEGTISCVSETQQGAMNGSSKEVVKMGREGKEDDCKGTYNRAMEGEGKEEFGNKEKGSNKKVEGSESGKAKMEKAGGNEGMKSKKEGVKDCEYEEEEEEEEEEEGSNGSIQKEDDILELFETSWLMKPTGKPKGNLMPRSASFL